MIVKLRNSLFVLVLFCCNPCVGQAVLEFGQHQVADSLLNMGLNLYALDDGVDFSGELASSGFNLEKVDRYVGYVKRDSSVHVLFLGKGKQPRVIYEFGSTFPYDPQAVHLMSADRALSAQEVVLMKLIGKLDKIGTTYIDKIPTGAQTNTYIVKDGQIWHAFMVTETFKPVTIGLGNEGYFKFNSKGRLKHKSRPNQNFVAINTRLPDGANRDEFASFNIHGKSSSAVASVGEVLLLLKHRSRIPWDLHVVLSSSFATLIRLDQINVSIMSREQWDQQMQ